MALESPQKSIRVIFVSLFTLLILVCSLGARGEERIKYTIETLPADKGPNVSRIWDVGPSIRIVEVMTLPNSCAEVDGEVYLYNHYREVSVKLHLKEKVLPLKAECIQQATPVAVSVTIPNMPNIPGCHHHITLQTPYRLTTDDVFLIW